MTKEQQALLEEAKQSIVSYNAKKAGEIANKALEAGIEPYVIITDGFVPGITEIGRLFERGQIFLPELIMAAKAINDSTAVCMAKIPKSDVKAAKKVVIGTVEGDVHSIGKSIVVSLLSANGFEVYDLGVNVSREKFVEKVIEVKADVVGTSSLLTTTMDRQKQVIEAINKAGLRDKVKTIIGGAPTSQSWADRIGSDAYGENAIDAVRKIKQLTGLS
jgi:trimethylamine corrinoid protein